MKEILVLIALVSIFQVSQAQTIEVSPGKLDIMQRYLAVGKEQKSFYENSIKPCNDKKKREYYNSPEWKALDKELKELFKTRDEIANRSGKLWGEFNTPPYCKHPYNFPKFNNKSDIKNYLESLNTYYSNYPDGPDGNIRKSLVGHCLYEITEELNNHSSKYIGNGNTNINTGSNSNLEAEFLAEIAKINSDIAVINRLAKEKQIVESFGSAQILCDKLRRYQGQQYFSTTLKKIRKENPGFSFSITPLAEQVTREYWIRMRNRANHAYRNAMDAYKGCVWNEGIQQAGIVEIPVAYFKLTYDMFNSVSDMLSKKLGGTLQKIYKGYQNPSESFRPVILISEDILAGGNDAYDWKTYVGIVGGVISGYDNFVKAQNMVTQYRVQGGLIQANRQSAQELIKSGKNLLEQFDKYRAFIDAHSSSIDCLNDRIMRIDLDNKSIKGDKITIWGTGLYDWTGEEFINQIKEAGEDLKNEYIYCEDFIKILQIAVSRASASYDIIEEKVHNSGADQTQITAQLSQNRENGDWFENESTRLSEYYVQFCEVESNTFPNDVEVVSTSIIPGVEEQNGNPDEPPVWEDRYDNTESNHDEVFDTHTSDSNNQNAGNHGSHNTNTGTYSGDGWTTQIIKNSPETLENDISKEINSGKTPTGIYVDNKEVFLQYINENPLGMTSWNMEWYNNAEELQSGISSNIETGYFPMGISFTNSGKLYVLYIMSKLSATAWQLVESELELSSVAQNIKPLINNQYVPVGITIYSGMYYTLMVQLPDAQMTNWTIEGYEDNNMQIQLKIDNMVSNGLVPFGYLKKDGVVNVLYVGF